jgi:hypothetical protein
MGSDGNGERLGPVEDDVLRVVHHASFVSRLPQDRVEPAAQEQVFVKVASKLGGKQLIQV